MNLGICPMASSSSGNCFLVRSNRTYILLDAGISSARVKKNLEMMDNIHIHVNCDEESRDAFEEHRDYIMKETLALQLNYTADSLEEFKLNGHITGIAVEKA